MIETARLRLEPFARRDLDALHAMFTEASFRRFLLDDTVVPRTWVQGEIEASAERFADNGCGLWAVRRHGSADIVGMTGFRPFFDPPELQLIYGLLPAHWGEGLATEAAAAVVRHGFERLGLDHVVAAADLPNVASFRVMERLGMRRVKTTEKGAHGTGSYALDRADWAAARG